jgi:hypothetical protein
MPVFDSHFSFDIDYAIITLHASSDAAIMSDSLG